jgi:hypothetical protein
MTHSAGHNGRGEGLIVWPVEPCQFKAEDTEFDAKILY